MSTLEEQEANFDTLCGLLETKDPDTKEVCLLYSMYPVIAAARAVRLGRALRGNTVVTKFGVRVDNIALAEIGGICHFISSNTKSLSDVTIYSCESSNTLASVEEKVVMVDQLLAAVSIHGNIGRLSLHAAFTAHSLAICLTSIRASLHSLELTVANSSIPAATTADDAQLVASAVRSLSSLEKLEFCCGNTQFLTLFLTRLGRAGGTPLKLKEFSLDTNGPGARTTHIPAPLAQAIRQTLASAPLLEKFSFYPELSQDTPNEANLDLVIGGIEHHPSLRMVSFCASAINNTDEGAARFAHLLQNNRNLSSLTVDSYSLLGVCTIMETLATTNHALEHLQVFGKNFLGEHFAEGHRQLGALLPLIKNLKKLELTCELDLDSVDELPAPIPQQFVRGFELNTSLTYVDIHWPLSKNKDIERAIEFYESRNEYSPPLADASKAEMLSIFEEMVESDYPESKLAVIFEALRVRDDWCDENDGDSTL